MVESDVLEQSRYLRAKKKVEKVKEVYVHIVVFVFCMPVIIITNMMFVPGFYYFWFAIFGWGMAVFLHWLVVIGFKSSLLFGKDWEDRNIHEAIQEERHHNKILQNGK